jgi:UDP-N-acetylmuramyl pentapeptide phosphotransferase/UDP-N-acetylglucosamine-1-phosphate transferase
VRASQRAEPDIISTLYRANGLSESIVTVTRRTSVNWCILKAFSKVAPVRLLALNVEAWQRRFMTDKKPPAPRAAGAIIALGLLAGTLIGIFLNQPSLGFLVGLALGSAIAIGLWFMDRRR